MLNADRKQNSLPPWLDPGNALDRAMNATTDHVLNAIHKEAPGLADFAALISPSADACLETMAQRAEALTRRHFGRTVTLYAPLYLSNYCSNGCRYCGFAADRRQPRHKLSLEQVTHELTALKQMGFEDVLLLTGGRTAEAGFEYLLECVGAAANVFHNVTIESFGMTEQEYAQLYHAGCNGVTLYQETYAPELYQTLHRWGDKKDYHARLAAPANALRAGMRTVGIGALLGLGDPVLEALCLFQHGAVLQREFFRAGISISFPRIRPQTGGYEAVHPVTDRFLAQLIFAFRISFPTVPLVMSTRERPEFRDGIAGLGISKMSVASRTTVGGYSNSASGTEGQFEVCDTRGIEAFCQALRQKGLMPVFKNVDATYR